MPKLQGHRVKPSTARPRRMEVDRTKKYDTVVTSGQSALRALLTMNGGAIVVFLTFVNRLWENETRKVPADSVELFVRALSWFIAGICLTLMAYGSIFITNCFSSVWWRKSSNGAFVATVVCGAGSLACFFRGGYIAVVAFRSVVKILAR